MLGAIGRLVGTWHTRGRLLLAAAIVWLGLFHGPVLRRMEPATRRYVETVQQNRVPSTADAGRVPLVAEARR